MRSLQFLVKICGVTSETDALAAASAGADLIGLNFHPASPRCLELDRAAAIAASVTAQHPRVGLVGVFVDAPLALMQAAVEACGLGMVQLHGSEDAAVCRSLPWPWFKAHRLRTDADLAAIAAIGSGAGGLFLADAWHPSLAGGTGRVLDSALAARAARLGPMLLAGGLTAETVAGAIAAVRPAGVDVSSGVESAPGKKDHALIRAFMERARAAVETVPV